MAENSDDTAGSRGRPFPPGQSGNPGGRPKKLEELTVPIGQWTAEFLDRAHHIVMNGEHKDSVAMLRVLWAYRYGSPAQVVTDEAGNPVRMGILVMPQETDAGG